MAGQERSSWGRVRGKRAGQRRGENRLKEESLDSEVESDAVSRCLVLLVTANISVCANPVSTCRMALVLGWRHSEGSR